MNEAILRIQDKFSKEANCLVLADEFKFFEVNDSCMTLIKNKNSNKEDEIFFGFTKLSNNFEEVKILFNQVKEYMKCNNIKKLIGPINYCSWFSYRFLTDKLNPMKIYPEQNNDDYYIDFLNKLGFEKTHIYESSLTNLNDEIHRKSSKIYDKIKKGGRYDIKMYKKGEETEEILKQIFDISSNSFKDKPFYTDIPFDLFKGIYMVWMKEIDYKLFTCVDKQNTIIGYALCYENPFDNKNFIIKTTAFKKDNTNKFLPVACRYMGHQYAIEQGYETALYHYQYVENKVSIKMTSKESQKIREYGVFTYSI